MSRPTPVLAEALRELAESSARPVVLIDGGAGAGKTTLARQLADHWPTPGVVQVVGLDELYPGWGGLAAGARAVPDLIRGTGFRTWDWHRGAPGDWRRLNPAQPLVVEGCGAITAASRALAGLAIWLEVDEAARRHRALARDGAEFASHWDDWAAQEAVHWLSDKPWELADLTLAAPLTP
ncbi:MAG TPA: AAA family ATPase [Propionicimonas sp.]|uniref:AAA family ATPase n=1 Tax=Propionicimonas sp. TaxID=1955623 RepID=UPI002F427400